MVSTFNDVAEAAEERLTVARLTEWRTPDWSAIISGVLPKRQVLVCGGQKRESETARHFLSCRKTLGRQTQQEISLLAWVACSLTRVTFESCPATLSCH